MENFYSRAEFIFSRFDKYLEAVNLKATLYLAINTFFVGAFFALMPSLFDNFIITELTGFFIATFLCCCFIAIFIVLLAVNPFLKSGTKNGVESTIFYYGSVADCDKEFYLDRLRGISKEDLEKDIGGQLSCLAEALKGKYNKLLWVGRLIMLEFALLIPIILLLSVHLKNNV